MISCRGTNLQIEISSDSHYTDTVPYRDQHPTLCASGLPPDQRPSLVEMDPNRPYQNITGIHDWRNWHWQDWPADARLLEQPEIPTTLNLYSTPIQEAFVQEPSPYPNTEHQGRPLHGHWRSNFRSRSASALPTSLSWGNSHDPLNVPAPRQIRFVSNDGQPHTKRRRIDKACQTCRRRKTRCSGERPECKTCSNNGHTCLGYVEPSPTKRSRPSGSSRLNTPETGASQASDSPIIQEDALLAGAPTSTSLPTGSGVRDPPRSADLREPPMLLPAFDSQSLFDLQTEAKHDSDPTAAEPPASSIPFSGAPALPSPGMGLDNLSSSTSTSVPRLAQPAPPLRASTNPAVSAALTGGSQLPPFQQSRKRRRAVDDVDEFEDVFDSTDDTPVSGESATVSPATGMRGRTLQQSSLMRDQLGLGLGLGMGAGVGGGGFVVSPTSVPNLAGLQAQMNVGVATGPRGLRRSTSATFPRERRDRALGPDWGSLGVGRGFLVQQRPEELIRESQDNVGAGQEAIQEADEAGEQGDEEEGDENDYDYEEA